MQFRRSNIIYRWLLFLTALTVILVNAIIVVTHANGADPWSKADIQREVAPIILYTLFVLLQLCDIYTTIKAKGVETYRITAWLMSKIGETPGIILLRTVSIVLVGALVWHVQGIMSIIGLVVLDIVWYVRIVYRNWQLM